MAGADRGQAYTLEGVIGAIILASALLYGLQAVDVAPYTGDDRSDRRLDSLRTQVEDALAVAADDGTLERAVTCVNTSNDGRPHSLIGQPPNVVTGGNVAGLGTLMNGTISEQGRQYSIVFDYWNASAGQTDSVMVYPNVTDPRVSFTREPVTVTRRVPVFNHTDVLEPVSGAGCQPTGQTFEERMEAGDPLWLSADTRRVTNSELHNVVTVRVIAW